MNRERLYPRFFPDSSSTVTGMRYTGSGVLGGAGAGNANIPSNAKKEKKDNSAAIAAWNTYKSCENSYKPSIDHYDAMKYKYSKAVSELTSYLLSLKLSKKSCNDISSAVNEAAGYVENSNINSLIDLEPLAEVNNDIDSIISYYDKIRENLYKEEMKYFNLYNEAVAEMEKTCGVQPPYPY